MSDNLPERVNLKNLSLDERANLSYDLFVEYSKGRSFNALAREHNMDPRGVKTLIDEHAAFERSHGSDSKMANINAYKFIVQKAVDVLENPTNHPALVQAKAYEAVIQSLTRLDKLGGHEAPTMHGEIPQDTVRDLIQRAYMEDDFNDISPTDHGLVGDVIDAEVVDD